MEFMLCDVHKMPRGHIGDPDTFVDKQESKTFSIGFCGLIFSLD
jgi:hypothetical protein